MPPQRSGVGDEQVLPRAELKNFIDVQKLYDAKNFKKALKTADGILKNHPKHGETLSMKGLLCNQLGRKEEAHRLCKQGLTQNLRSPTCWHVYGLVHKSDRNYVEASKCYKNAIRMDGPDSPNLGMILRDLSQMQLQLRDLKGFLESRSKFLSIGSNIQFTSAWISLALAHHLLKDYNEAVRVLQRLQTAKTGLKDSYEMSEIYLYEAYIYKDGGMFEQALAVLDKAAAEGAIRDVTGAMEMRAELFASLGRMDEAKDLYFALLDVNTENHKYHDRLIGMVRADIGDHVSDRLEDMYKELCAKYPKSRSCKRIPLDFDLPEDRFKERLREFVTPYVQKGIPSLFSELAPLYGNMNKVRIIGETLLELLKSADANNEESFWVGLCLAMHYSTVGMNTEAIRVIDRVIGQAPDDFCLIDAYSAKSRILDTVGDYLGAAEMAENARKLDLADRYINCQATMALFKSLQPIEAEAVCQLFTQGGNNNFYDMQATWYELASGQCYLELKDYGQALKRFKKVEEHYMDFIDDQFDFFAYCTSKQTMRAYVDMLRVMDGLHSSKTLATAVAAAVRVYIHLSKHPYKTEMELLEERMGEMNPNVAGAELRKLREKLRKEELEREKVAAEASKGTHGHGNQDADGGIKKADPDPKGIKLVSTKDPLGDAKKMVDVLLIGAPNELSTHLLAYCVDVRRVFSASLSSNSTNIALPMKHVHSAVRVAGASHPRVHECIVDLVTRSATASLAPEAQAEITALLGGESVSSYHDSWKTATADSTDLDVVIVAAKLDDCIAGANAEKAAAAWTACAARLKAQPEILHKAGHEQCRSILAELEADENVLAAKNFREVCGSVFTLSNTFASKAHEIPDLSNLSLS